MLRLFGGQTQLKYNRKQACSFVPLWYSPTAFHAPQFLKYSQLNARRHWYNSLTAVSASKGADGGSRMESSEEERRAIRDNVDKATQMLEEILEEISDEIFVAQATAYLTDEPEDASSEAVRQAVARRLEFMDANFLAALNAYAQVAEVRKDQQMLSVLVTLHEEVLAQVSQRLPPAARVLDLVLRLQDKDQRVQVLKLAMDGGDGSIPCADAGELAATASQFIDDMEEQQVIPDRRLLARLCLVREEVRLLDLERTFSGGSKGSSAASVVRSNVPQRCIAFLKELITVSDPMHRAGLMQQAFAEDWTGEVGSRKVSSEQSWEQQQAERLGKVNRQQQQQQQQQQKPGADFVRPGRFMGMLHAMIAELEHSGNGADGGAVLQRMDAIKLEVLTVLDRMQRV